LIQFHVTWRSVVAGRTLSVKIQRGRLLLVGGSQVDLALFSKLSAYSAPSGMSSCLKYTKTSPCLLRFLTRDANPRRVWAEYSPFRRRR